MLALHNVSDKQNKEQDDQNCHTGNDGLEYVLYLLDLLTGTFLLCLR